MEIKGKPKAGIDYLEGRGVPLAIFCGFEMKKQERVPFRVKELGVLKKGDAFIPHPLL